MKRIQTWRWVLAALLLVGATGRADEFAIQSFDATGRLTYGTLNDGTNYNYRVEWAPSAAGPWSDFASSGANWLGARPQASGAVVTNRVPMCYRVVANRGDYMSIDISGEAAALDAVNGLPFVLGEPPKALPAPGRTMDAEMVRQLAEGMTPKTWRNLRADLLALAAGESTVPR